MKSIYRRSMMLVAFAAALLSFTSRFGGEGFEIYLNGNVLLQQFGKDISNPKNLQLGKLRPEDKLTIRYYHCGQPGRNRVITLKDEKDRVLKVWRYNNTAPSGEMLCRNQDILSLQHAGSRIVKLYYASSEIPAGRLLVQIDLTGLAR